MKFDERKEKILSMLYFNEKLTVDDIVKELKISPATARRDIIRLEQNGDITKYWGGIKSKNSTENQRENTLSRQIADIKYAKIGEYAASKVNDNELIFIGSGLTTLAMIPFLNNKNINVITNGIPQLEALHKKNINALLLCGFFKEYSKSLVGKETVEMLSKYKFDKSFIGANGVDENLRLLSADGYEDSIKNLCITQSKETYLMIGSEKFHRMAYYSVCSEKSKDVYLITNSPEYNSKNWINENGIYTSQIKDLLV